MIFSECNKLEFDKASRYDKCHYDIGNPEGGSIGPKSQPDNLHCIDLPLETRKILLDIMPVKQDDVVLELGAYRGYGTLWLSERVTHVIALEADKANYEILSKNIKINELINVTAVNKGVSNDKGRTILFKKGNQQNSIIPNLVSYKSTDIIDIDTVDNILASLGIENITFIIMEINNSEILALDGMKKLLTRDNIRLTSAGWYLWKDKPAWITIKGILLKYGFKVFIGKEGKIYAFK